MPWVPIARCPKCLKDPEGNARPRNLSGNEPWLGIGQVQIKEPRVRVDTPSCVLPHLRLGTVVPGVLASLRAK